LRLLARMASSSAKKPNNRALRDFSTFAQVSFLRLSSALRQSRVERFRSREHGQYIAPDV
jgi:hypothetical protein